MHERVDLELRVVEGVRGRLLHLPVDDLPHPRVQAHLGGRERNGGWGGWVKDSQPQAPNPDTHPCVRSPGKLGTNATPWEALGVSIPEYRCTGARVFCREEQGGVSPDPPCVPLLGRGMRVGGSHPGDAVSRDAAPPRPDGALLRFRPRSTTRAPVPLHPRGAGKGWGGIHKHELNPLPSPQTHPQPLTPSPNCRRAAGAAGREPFS